MSADVPICGRVLVAVSGLESDAWLDVLNLLAPERRACTTVEPDEFTDIHYAVVWKPEPGLLQSLPNLKVVFSLGAGVDHVIHHSGMPDVPVVRVVADDLTGRMAEYVVWQVMNHHRQALFYQEQQKQRAWIETPQPAAGEITVGIMGLGVLGQESGQILRRIGFNVIGWSRTPKNVVGIGSFSGDGELDEFLGQTDILVVLLPLTAKTRGCINADLLAKLRADGPLVKPTLINAGRGDLQVESDILVALDDGVLGAASLDVFESEPLPADSALWQHPRVIITPHIAAISDPSALVPLMVAQMDAFERGGPLSNLVDPVEGY